MIPIHSLPGLADFSYQQAWFKVLLAVAAIGVLWLIHSLRLKRVTSEVQVRLSEVLSERERIARELHDTLQGMQAVILRCQTAADELAREHPAKLMLEEALKQSDQVMIEGRERVERVFSRTYDSGTDSR